MLRMADEASPRAPSSSVALGRIDDLLAEPGSFFTHDAEGLPLLVTRDEDGGVHVLVNRCRHRGALLTGAACGKATAFACPLHGWTYDLRGNLTVPGMPRSLPTGPRHEGALVELPVEVKDGTLWVTLPRRPSVACE